MISFKGDKKNRPILLLLALLILSSIFTIYPGKQRGFFELIGESSLKVYTANVILMSHELQDSYAFINEIGQGTLDTYELGGIIFYTGIKGVVETYSNLFEKVSAYELPNFSLPKLSFDFDKKFLAYTANVSSGFNVVNDYAKENTNKSINSINSFFDFIKGITEENLGDVKGGFQVLIENISSSFGTGASKMGYLTANSSSVFLSNIKNNLNVIVYEVSNFSSSIQSGIKNTFSFEIPKVKGEVKIFNLANVFSVEKEIVEAVNCKFKDLIGSTCRRDLEEEKADFLRRAEQKAFNLASVSSSQPDRDVKVQNVTNVIYQNR